MSKSAPSASGLYPIVRRVRRPLIIQDDDSGPAPAPAPSAVPSVEGETGVSYAKTTSPLKGKHAPATTRERAS
jgi:hypothetical protein